MNANPIKKLRDDRGWTQKKAAEKAGLTQQKWSRLERAPDIVGMQKKSIKAVRDAFGLTWVDLAIERHNLIEAKKENQDGN